MKHFLIFFCFLVLAESVPVTKSPFELDNWVTWKLITFRPKQELIGHFRTSPNPSELFHLTKSPLELKRDKVGNHRTFPPGAFTYKPPRVGPPKRSFAPLEESAQKVTPLHYTMVTVPPLEEKVVPPKDHSKPPPCRQSIGCSHVRSTAPPK